MLTTSLNNIPVKTNSLKYQLKLTVLCVCFFLQKVISAYWSKRRVGTNGSFQNRPNSFRDGHYMLLPQYFPYRISTMQSFKSYLFNMCASTHIKVVLQHLLLFEINKLEQSF